MPVIGLVQVGRQALADRYTYVPLIGVFVAIAWALPPMLLRRPALRLAAAAVAVAGVIACASVTSAQVAHWQTNAAVWERALAVTLDVDASRARMAVAAVTKDARHVNDAIAAYFRADRLAGRQLLGLALFGQGHVPEAIATLREVIAEQPDLAPAQSTLGRFYGQLGQFDRAAEHLGDRRAADAAATPARAPISAWRSPASGGSTKRSRSTPRR